MIMEIELKDISSVFKFKTNKEPEKTSIILSETVIVKKSTVNKLKYIILIFTDNFDLSIYFNEIGLTKSITETRAEFKMIFDTLDNELYIRKQQFEDEGLITFDYDLLFKSGQSFCKHKINEEIYERLKELYNFLLKTYERKTINPCDLCIYQSANRARKNEKLDCNTCVSRHKQYNGSTENDVSHHILLEIGKLINEYLKEKKERRSTP